MLQIRNAGGSNPPHPIAAPTSKQRQLLEAMVSDILYWLLAWVVWMKKGSNPFLPASEVLSFSSLRPVTTVWSLGALLSIGAEQCESSTLSAPIATEKIVFCREQLRSNSFSRGNKDRDRGRVKTYYQNISVASSR